jgi:alkanesulfonate monooxygenase SsuD/methylene tetrahydromethanopterin reductase-like flavin-dependent oxidoreductase (luciferase family)
LKHYEDGADEKAIESVFGKRAGTKPNDRITILKDRFEDSRTRIFYGGLPFVAGPQKVADMIEELVVDGEVDGVMFVFPDFIEGLKRFDQLVILSRRCP